MRELAFILLISTHMSAGCNMWDVQCTTAIAKRTAPSLIKIVNEEGHPDIDPMIINLIQIHEEGLHLVTQDVKIYGLSNYIVDHLRFDKLANMSQLIIHTDFYLTGLYKSNGTVLSCPVYGDGVFRVALKNTELELTAHLDRVKHIDGTEFDTIKDYQFRYDVKDKVDYQFENLYYGHKELSDRMHYMLNTYWKMVIEVHGQRYMRLIADTLVKALRVYLKKVPLSTFFTL